MARRSLFGALCVAIVAASSTSAFAATAPSDAPQLATPMFVSPALLQWIPGSDPRNVSQTVMRAPGSCDATDGAAVPVTTYEDNTTSEHLAQPGEGIWCFSILVTDSDGNTDESAGRTVRIDTTPPTATVAVSRLAAGGIVNGTVRISGSSSDEFSGIAGRSFHVGPVGACASGPAVTAMWNTTSVPNGTYDVCHVATDLAGNVGTASLTVVVSNPVPAVATAVAAPPASGAPVVASAAATPAFVLKAPSKLVLVLPRRKGGAPTLRWRRPPSSDLAHVVVVFNRKRAPRAPDDGQVIYRGLRSSVKLALRAGQRANVALYAYDHAGNVSAPARRVVSLAALLPLRPITGSTVTGALRLSWKPRAGAKYYNVQVFYKGTRVRVGWPRHAWYRLPKKALHPGTYVWFVWPALKGRRAGVRFSELIGRATFVYKK
jgi:hypothetical protein